MASQSRSTAPLQDGKSLAIVPMPRNQVMRSSGSYAVTQGTSATSAYEGTQSSPSVLSDEETQQSENQITWPPNYSSRQPELSRALAIPADSSRWRQRSPPSVDLVHVPALQKSIIPFKFVEPGLDLNVAPENWLRGMHRLLEQRARHPNYFSSFPIAEAVASSVSWQDAAVDIISHSRNIKRLLSSPVSRQSLNLIVHRIGETLLVDDFDGVGGDWTFEQDHQASSGGGTHGDHATSPSIRLEREQRLQFQAYLQENAELLALGGNHNASQVRTSVSPPRNLIAHLPQGGADKDTSPVMKRKKNPSLQKRLALESKFLARSIAVESDTMEPHQRTAPPSLDVVPHRPVGSIATTPHAQSAHRTDDPEGGPQVHGMHSVTAAGREHQHAWVFNNLRCLLSSDLSIFGDEAHPAVTLHLRDRDKPIQILTGMDMWLDNLMCNVPEVIMCYHLNGIVQQYELLQTDDLPASAGFAPDIVHDIAQNICSFLRTNCAHEGHTYWLYKDKDSDVVRLYDLTVLSDAAEQAGRAGKKSTSPRAASNGARYGSDEETPAPDAAPTNPFKDPVVMLLFRIATRMYCEEDRTQPRTAQTIRSLLQNMLSLVQDGEFPDVVAFAKYMLAGLSTTWTSSAGSPKAHYGDDDTASDDGQWGRGLPDDASAPMAEDGSTDPVHSFALRSLHGRSNALMSAPPPPAPASDSSSASQCDTYPAPLSPDTAETGTPAPQSGTDGAASGTNNDSGGGAHAAAQDAGEATADHEHRLRSQLEQLASGMAILHDVSDSLRASLLVAFLRRAIDTYHSLSTHHCRAHPDAVSTPTSTPHAVEAVRCMKLALVCLFAMQKTAEENISDIGANNGADKSSHAEGSTPSATSVLPVPHTQLLNAPDTDDVMAALLEQIGDMLSQMDTYFPPGSLSDATARQLDRRDEFDDVILGIAANCGTADTNPSAGGHNVARSLSAAERIDSLVSQACSKYAFPTLTPALTAERALQQALGLYELALATLPAPPRVPVPRAGGGSGDVASDGRVRLWQKCGNAHNTIGIHQLHAVVAFVNESAVQQHCADTAQTAIDPTIVQQQHTLFFTMCESISAAFSTAVKCFQRAADRLNEAFVWCNLAKLRRVQNASKMIARANEPSEWQRKLHEQTIEYYAKGRTALGLKATSTAAHTETSSSCGQDSLTSAWNSITLDVAGANLAYAKYLHEHATAGSGTLERLNALISELLQKALTDYKAVHAAVHVAPDDSDPHECADVAKQDPPDPFPWLPCKIADVHYCIAQQCVLATKEYTANGRGTAKASLRSQKLSSRQRLAEKHYQLALQAYNRCTCSGGENINIECHVAQWRVMRARNDSVTGSPKVHSEATLQLLRRDLLHNLQRLSTFLRSEVANGYHLALHDVRLVQQELSELSAHTSKALLEAMKLHRATGSGMSSAGQPQAGTVPGVVASASYDKYKGLYGTLLQHIVAQTSACSETASEAGQKDTLAIVKGVDHLSAILQQL
eukprot:m.960648 g.960648  ORF g.960648 m.960648 type:complete len:1494 (-) comp23886_c3_seq22:2375-6856(-)